MTKSTNIKGAYPLEVEEIVFFDGTILKNKVVMLCGEFVIVEGENGREPSMYNTRGIEMLSRVKEIRPSQKVSVSSYF